MVRRGHRSTSDYGGATPISGPTNNTADDRMASSRRSEAQPAAVAIGCAAFPNANIQTRPRASGFDNPSTARAGQVDQAPPPRGGQRRTVSGTSSRPVGHCWSGVNARAMLQVT